MRAVVIDAGLRPEHFASKRHRAIFAAAQRVAARDEPVDHLTVSAELKRAPEAVAGAGRGYVSRLASVTPAPGNAPHYAKRVVECAQLRAYRAGALRVLEGVGAEDRVAIQDGLERAQADIEHAAEPVDPLELADEFAEYVFSEEPAEVFKLPFPVLNNAVAGGLRRGQVTVIVGHSSHGKSTLLDELLLGFHKQGFRSMMFVTEMNRIERVARFVASYTGIPYARLMLRRVARDEQGTVVDALNHIPYLMREAAGMSVEAIAQEIIARRVDVAAVDPLHAINYRDTNELRQISQKLVRVAKRAGVHLILVAHLNLARAKDVKKPFPVPRDIRDSGSIYADADNVLAIHRKQDSNGDPTEEGELGWLKVRNGLLKRCKVTLEPGSFRFEPVRREPMRQDALAAATDEL